MKNICPYVKTNKVIKQYKSCPNYYNNKIYFTKKYKKEKNKKMESNFNDIELSGWGIFGIIAFMVLILFFGPLIFFWLNYFSGWIAKMVIGKYIVAGFELIGITLPIDKIPLLAGVLGWIGGFFKVITPKTKNN